ncbi:phage major capsid protein [Candidatus Solincola tengchongensis]|uniref:phage major capsid protein n=1 Tax=Candidatus Solincola tengchongensis TaxID=2900693 RepID=UPI00257B878A|nr:phage major capsid protein [Candidatus Solincola tengchongensis]
MTIDLDFIQRSLRKYLEEADHRENERAQREVLDRMNQILKTAEKEGRDLNFEEIRQIDELEKRLNFLRSIEHGQPVPIIAGMEVERGDDIRLLRPDQEVRSVMGRSEFGSLSLGKYLRGIVTGDWRGAAAEHRALEQGDSTLGGFLVPHPLSTKIIDLARNRSVCINAGALTVPMESSDFSFAAVTKDPVAYWRAEHETVTESDMNFALYRMKANTLAAIVRCSIELFEDAMNLDQIVTNSLAQALALELDRACLFGQGASNEPLGLYSTEGVNVVDMGANGSPLSGYKEIVEAVGRILEANGPDPRNLALIMSPREYTQTAIWTDDVGQPLRPPAIYEEIGKKLVTNQIRVDMEKGAATNASCIFLGDFSQLWIGMRTDLRIEVSREAGDAFSKLQVLIRAYLRADVLVVRPGWFTIIDGIIPPS